MSRARRFASLLIPTALVAALSFVQAPRAEAAAAFVKVVGTDSATAVTAGAPYSATVTVPGGGVAAGNSVIVLAEISGDAISCSDSVNGAYANDIPGGGPGAFPLIASRHGVAALPAGATITCSANAPAGGGGAILMSALEFSGLLASPLDQTTRASGTSTAPSSGPTPPTTAADELVVGAIGNESCAQALPDLTPAAGLTAVGSVVLGGQAIRPMFQVVSATGSYSVSGTFSASDCWDAGVATYKATAGGGPTSPPSGAGPAFTTCPAGPLMVPLISLAPSFQFNAPVSQAVQASESDTSRVITLSLSGASPSWASLTNNIPGNPANATLRLAPGVFDYLFGAAGNIAILATDNRQPAQTATCDLSARLNFI